jgi:gliding motility-associated protein GldL
VDLQDSEKLLLLKIRKLKLPLSKKLDDMLKEAKIDANLMSSLGDSIRNFEGAAKGIAPTVDAMASQKKYSEELTLAAAQMETLNNLYKVQVESSSRQAEINQEVAENAGKLKEQMGSLAANLSSLEWCLWRYVNCDER